MSPAVSEQAATAPSSDATAAAGGSSSTGGAPAGPAPRVAAATASAHPSLCARTKLGAVSLPDWVCPLILYDEPTLDVGPAPAPASPGPFTALAERWRSLCNSEFKTLPIANACCVQSLPGGPDVGCGSADCAAARRHYDAQEAAKLVERRDIHGRVLPRAKNRGGYGYWKGYLYLLAIDVELAANSFRDKMSAEALKSRWSAAHRGRPADTGIDRRLLVVRSPRPPPRPPRHTHNTKAAQRPSVCSCACLCCVLFVNADADANPSCVGGHPRQGHWQAAPPQGGDPGRGDHKQLQLVALPFNGRLG